MLIGVLSFTSHESLINLKSNFVRNENESTQKKDSIQTNTKQTPAKPQKRPSPLIKATESYLKEYLGKVVVKYGLDYDKMDRTILGESTYDPNKDNGLSVGIAQYILTTWLANCSKTDERKDPYKSIDCMGKMWSQGQEGQWDVYCNYWLHPICQKRGLYPGFLDK